MALRIVSDIDEWSKVAYNVIPGGEGGDDQYEVKPDAYAFVVLGSMMVGMDVLDTGTAEEWLTRLRAWEIVDGPMLRDGDGNPAPVTLDMLRPFFGTRTNVFPRQTKTAFARRVGIAVMERASRR